VTGDNGAIPRNWAVARVQELFDVVGGGTPSTEVAEYWQGTTPWISSADIDERHRITPRRSISEQGIKNSATSRVPAGSVIVVTRVGLGKVGIAETPICFSQDSQALVFSQEFLSPKYVLLYMGTAVQVFKHISRGTTISGVTKKQLHELQFRLPPLAEQKRIVEEIEKQFTRLDAAVVALKRVQANLKRYRAAVLKTACEGRLVPTEAELARREGRPYEPASALLERILTDRRARWEAKQLSKSGGLQLSLNNNWKAGYSAPKGPATKGLAQLPDGWEWARLDQISNRVTDGTHQPPQFEPSGIPFVFVQHIVGGKLTFEGTKFISESTYATLNDRCPVKRGDILYSAVGSYGVAVRVNTDQPFSFQRHIAHIKPSDFLSSEYLADCLNSPVCLAQAHRCARGVAQKTVTLGNLCNFSIPVPPALEQQRIAIEIERRFSFLDKIELSVRENLTRSNHLRQTILNRAFAGKLVSQDPNDEPASALLERIRGTAISDRAPVRAKSNKPSRRAPVSKETVNA